MSWFSGRDGAILEGSWAGQHNGFEHDPPVSQGRQWGPEESRVGHGAVPAVACAVRVWGPGVAALSSRALPLPLLESLSGLDPRPHSV